MQIKIESQLDFEMLHVGLILAANHEDNAKVRNITRIRLENKILDALDVISESTDEKMPTGDTVRKWVSGDLELTPDMAKLLAEYLEFVPWKPIVSRRAVMLIDKLREE